MNWVAPRMWEGGRCFILGGGPSMVSQFDIPQELVARVRDPKDPLGPEAYSPFMSNIHDEHVVAVNNSYLLGDWPDICFFGDWGWYRSHRLRLSQWPGLKVTHCPVFSDARYAYAEGVRYIPRDRAKRQGLSPHPGRLSWGFNSGSSAVDLAVHLGARTIILLGFDMHSGPNGETHWHPGHGNGHRPPSYARFLRGFPEIAADAAKMGVEIINCSSGSAITVFPTVGLREVL